MHPSKSSGKNSIEMLIQRLAKKHKYRLIAPDVLSLYKPLRLPLIQKAK
jgi:hypothetical protein